MRFRFRLLLVSLFAFGCERGEPPGASTGTAPLRVSLRTAAASVEETAGPTERLGTLEDNLPFAPTGTKIYSVAYRTWVYTETGPTRTRLGYLRAGAELDARGPAIVNSGCEGGWYRINPRGFVCLGKGATLDRSHPIVEQAAVRPRLGEGFPYYYAQSAERPPERYFRLPERKVVALVEGPDALERGPNWLERRKSSPVLSAYPVDATLPGFLDEGRALTKPYGVKMPMRTLYHAGRVSRESGFAITRLVEFEGRAYALTTEMDLLAADRLEFRPGSALAGVEIPEGAAPLVGFHLKGGLPIYRREESGRFSLVEELREKRGFLLTGEKDPSGLAETGEGTWVPRSALRILEPRTEFPSVATGSRRWIDISIDAQSLVAYEGRRAVFATLVSTGRGKMGDPETTHATVRGTFMIYEKSISSTMDGSEDRADSYELSDVPFVQYFHKGYALHGAYWHDEFGTARSHGCINLTPADSAWLFRWTDPEVPEGWHAVLNKERGTVVSVRR